MARSFQVLPGVWWLLAGPDERDGTLEAVRAALAAAGVAPSCRSSSGAASG